MAEDAAGLSVEDAQDDVLRFAGLSLAGAKNVCSKNKKVKTSFSYLGEDNAGSTEVLRPKFQWRSKICHNMAVVFPIPRSGSAEISTSFSVITCLPASSFTVVLYLTGLTRCF